MDQQFQLVTIFAKVLGDVQIQIFNFPYKFPDDIPDSRVVAVLLLENFHTICIGQPY